MLKIFISFLFFVFINPLFSKDLLIVNNVHYCSDGSNFSSIYNQGYVHKNLYFSYNSTSTTRPEVYLVYRDFVERNGKVSFLYLDVGDNCDNVDITSKRDYLPDILNYLHNNVGGVDVNYASGQYNLDNKLITIKDNIPSLPSDFINADLDVFQLNFLYGLSGIICASFLLFRIS